MIFKFPFIILGKLTDLFHNEHFLAFNFYYLHFSIANIV